MLSQGAQPMSLTYSMFHKNGTKSAKQIHSQFKNVPNLQTRGATFDVRHLDQFIQYDALQRQRAGLMTAQGSSQVFHKTLNEAAGNTGQNSVQQLSHNEIESQSAAINQNEQQTPAIIYGATHLSSTSTNRKRAQTATGGVAMIMSPQQQQLLSKRQFKISNIPIVYTNVRPSTSFISIPRENHAQTKYIDEQTKGPSSMIRRDGLSTMRSQGKQLHFHTERDRFSSMSTQQKEAETQIHQFQGFQENQIIPEAVETNVKFPSQRRQEIQQMKQAISTFQEMKSQKIFIKKRNRLIQNGWRDGILGVEMPGDKNSYFYSANILKEEAKKAQRLDNRHQCKFQFLIALDLQVKTGQSDQIGFSSNDKTMRLDGKIVPMYHGWTSKQVSDVRFRDTQNALFGDVQNKWKVERAQKLMQFQSYQLFSQEETKGRSFNPVSGASHFLLK